MPHPATSLPLIRTLVLSAVTIALTACAGAEPAAPAEGPAFITDGSPTGPSFGNVGALLLDFDGSGTIDGNEQSCSGGLIAPTVFLTAAHCVFFLPADEQVYVSFDAALLPGPPSVIAAEAFHFDPAFGRNNDLAVVILPEGSTEGITPLLLPPAGFLDAMATGNGLRGRLFINVGYGVDASQRGRPFATYDGIRKTSKSPFMALLPNWLRLLTNTNATGQGGVCYGDSGSPHFLDGAPGMAVATTSAGDRLCRARGDTYRLDTPSARAFLGQFVALP